MIHLNNHIINKEVFEFTCYEAEYAFQLQHQMNQALQDNVERTLDNVFEAWNENGDTIRIDKLEIDLGEIPFHELSEHLPAKLRDQLTGKFRAIKTADIPYVVNNGVSNTIREIELLEYVLTNGSLPWWTRPAAEFSFTEILRAMIRDHITDAKAILVK